MSQDRFLILSDGKPGHFNQAIAFVRHLGGEYDIQPVAFRSRVAKVFSYLADRIGYYTSALYHMADVPSHYRAVVSAGSGTYYANRTLARRLGCKSVAIMLPQGYRLDGFDFIVAQEHDDPPRRENILTLPINLSYIEPQGLVTPKLGSRYLALVIGGDSAQGTLDVSLLRSQIERILSLLPDHRVWLTTSRRTSPAIETMLREFPSERAIFYSVEPINPIPDFLNYSDYVFITADSSSMISEAVSYGSSCVEVLPLSRNASVQRKFGKLLDALQRNDCLHLFAGELGQANGKISVSELLTAATQGKI